MVDFIAIDLHLSELDYLKSISQAYSDARKRHFRRSYLKANKVHIETRTVKYAYHF